MNIADGTVFVKEIQLAQIRICIEYSGDMSSN